MKRFCIFVFLVLGGLLSVNAQDMIVLRDGNLIGGKVMEISPTEIRYKRSDNLNGPMIVIPKDRVLSIKYENGVLDIISASPPAGSNGAQQPGTPAPGVATPLQIILNALPAIPIAGNSLKFQFGGDRWTATVNGQNFSAGTIESEDTDSGSLLTLKQTHIWPGAVGKTAGRIANRIPGASAAGGALNTAGNIAGAVGPIEASGPVIVLEYKAGPPARLSFLRSATAAVAASDNQTTGAQPLVAAAPVNNQTAGEHPLVAENRFDLNGFNVFAISIAGMPLFWRAGGGGVTMTLFEKYKSNAVFSPSFFISGKYYYIDFADRDDHYYYGGADSAIWSAGVLFKHRFPRNRVLWNFGASLEFMLFYYENSVPYTYYRYDYNGYSYSYTLCTSYYTEDTTSFLLGMGIQTGFSIRFNPYTSLDLNGVFKFPFGTLDKDMEKYLGGGYYGYNAIGALPENKSFWPFTGGIELGLTFWFPYRSHR